MRMTTVLNSLLVCALLGLSVGAARAGAVRSGFTASTLAANDDGSSPAVSIGFTADFFGLSFSQVFVNNNGNVTLGSASSTFTPFGLAGSTSKIFAPFFADVDTEGAGSGLVQYGTGTVDGRAAFGANWVNVGYYEQSVDKKNSFQLVLIDRSDTGAGNFDFEFNYDQVLWETGDSSGGSGGLGGTSATVGYTKGTDEPRTLFEFIGSRKPGSFLNSNATTGLVNGSAGSATLGRYVFQVRGGAVQNPSGLNSQPTLVNFRTSASFQENTVNAAAQVIDSDVKFNDDQISLNGGTLSVTYSSGGGSQDHLAVRNQGSGSGQISFSEGNVGFAGTTIGTVPTSGAGSGVGGQSLVVTFNSNATVESVDALIQNLTYQNTSHTPVASRTISLVVNDGAGASTTAANCVIQVSAQNDIPTLSTVSTLTGATAGTAFTITYATLAAAADEADGEGSAISFRVEAVSSGSLTKSGVPVTAGSTLLSAGESWVWTPASSANGDTAAFTVKAFDGVAASASAVVVSVSVTGSNQAPTLTTVNTLTGALEDTAFAIGYSLLADAANEADANGDAISFRIEAVSSGSLTKGGNPVTAGATLLSAGESLLWSPAANSNGTLDAFTIKAWDGQDASGSAVPVKVTVTAVNDAPSFLKGADQTVLEDAGAQSVPGWATAVSPGPADEAGQTVTFQVSNDNTALFAVQPSVAANGTLSYTPAAQANGSATVTVSLADNGGTANGGTDTSAAQTFTISVTAVNDAPTLAAPSDPPAILEDAGLQTVSLSGIGSGTGNETQVLTVTAVSDNPALIPNPTVTYTSPSATGTLSYTPVADANGTATITVTVSDDGGTANSGVNTTTRTFTVTVTAVNDAPSFVNGADQTVLEDAGAQTVPGWAASVSPGPADEAGQTVTFQVSNDNTALFAVQPSVAANGTLSYTPAAQANGSATVTVSLADTGGTANGGADTSAAQTFTIHVTAVNDVPTLAALSDPTAILEDAGLQTVNLSGIGSGTGNETQVLTVTAVSDNPGLIPNPTVSYTSPNATGALNYTPVPEANGTATITVTVSDDGGTANSGVNTTTRTFTVTVTPVNDAPSFVKGADQTVLEDAGAQSVSGWATSISPGPADEAGQTVTFQVSNDNTALFAVPPSIAANGTLSYTPAAQANGSATVTVSLADNGGTANGGTDTSAAQTFTISVTAVNDAPTLAAPSDPSAILEDAGLQTVNLSGIGSGTGNETQVLTVTAVSDNPALIPNPTVTYTSPNATGTLSYTPVADANGTATITVTVSDDGGTANSGVNTTTRTFTVTVTSVNDAPSFVKGADQTVLEDAGAQSVSGWAASISPGPADEAGQTVTFQVSNDNTALFAVQPSIAANGTLSYTPAAQANGSATVTVNLVDNGGTANGGDDTSAAQTFTINVTAVNDAPTLAAPSDPAAILEDAGLQTVNLSGIGSGTGNETQVLTVTAVSDNPGLIPNPTVSFTSPNATGTLSYTPVAEANGTATITVTVSDDGGTANSGVNTTTRTFTVTVTAVNDAPSFVNGADQTVLEDAGAQSVSGWAASISSGPADEAGQTVTFQVSNDNTALFAVPPSVAANGTLSYTPAAQANGSATVTVSLADTGGTANGGADTSAAQTFTISVAAVNDAPTLAALSDPAAILEDAGLQTVSLSGIGSGTGNETQVLTVTAVSDNPGLIPNPTVSYTSPNATGALNYTPVPEANGTATITVTVSDDGGTANSGVNTTTRTFTVTVTPVNDAPRIDVVANQTILEDSASLDVAVEGIRAGPSDEMQALTLTAVSSNPGLIPHPVVTYTSAQAAGVLTFAPLANANGTATVTVTLSDDGGTADGGVNISIRTFEITVLPVNDAPGFLKGSDQAVLEDAGPQSVAHWASQIMAGPNDEAGQVVHFLVSNNNPNLFSSQPAVAPDGTLTYRTASDLNGSALVEVRAVDNGGVASGGMDTSSAQSFVISVIPVNDPPVIARPSDLTIPEDSEEVVVLLSGIGPGGVGESQRMVVTVTSNDRTGLPHPRIEYDGFGSTAVMRLQPSRNAHGSFAVSVAVRDDGGVSNGGADSVIWDFQVHVTSVNDLPELTGVRPLAGGAEDLRYSIRFEALEAAADVLELDGDEIQFRIEVVQAGRLMLDGVAVRPGETRLSAGMALTWDPPADVNGLVEAFTIRAHDGQSASVAFATVLIELSPVNDSPVIAAVNGQRLSEDSSLVVALEVSDRETAPEQLTVNVEGENARLFPAGNILISGGAQPRLVLVPGPDEQGETIITVTVRDPEGATGRMQFPVVIDAVNDAPNLTAVKTLSIATAGVPFILSHETLAGAADESDPDGDPVSFRIERISNGTVLKNGASVIEGATLLAAGESWVWTPGPESHGIIEAFTIKASDGQVASRASVTVTVIVNTPPTLDAVQPLVGASIGQPYTISYSDLIEHSDAADADGDVLTFELGEIRHGTLIANGESAEAGSSVLGAGGEWVWTPGTNGVVSAFAVTVRDGQSSSERPVLVRVAVAVPIQRPAAKLMARDGAAGDLFGNTVAVEGETAVAGSYLADLPGMNAAGAVYIFGRDGTNWIEQHKLTARDAAAGARFGSAVSISGDTLAVGANQAAAGGLEFAGAVYVFVRNGAEWVQQARLTAGNAAEFDLFGSAVAISGDTLVVGASQAGVAGHEFSGAAYVFQRDGTNWVETARLSASDAADDDGFGVSVALAGETLVIGAFVADWSGKMDAGAAYVYGRSGTGWIEQAKLTASRGADLDRFGSSVAISGDTVVVGANRADRMDEEQSESGASYVFTRSGDAWVEQARLSTSDGLSSDWLGTSVAISGEHIVVGAFRADLQRKPDSGGVYLFQRSGGGWMEKAKLLAHDPAMGDRLGSTVAIQGRTILAGAVGVDLPNRENTGAAYAFELLPDGSVPAQEGPGLADAPLVTVASFQSSIGVRSETVTHAAREPVRMSYGGSTADGALRIQVSGPDGTVVQLQASNDLGDWTVIATVTLRPDSVYVAEESEPGDAARFYRVVTLRGVSSE